MLFVASSALAQQQSVKINGMVVDVEKTPLVGVNVAIKGASTVVITDDEGRFYLDVPDKASALVFSYVGFESQEIVVGNQINFYIILRESMETLNEVIATGYGAQKRVSIAGAITTIEPQKLRVGTTRSVANNLAGQLAGIIAVRQSGEPGYDDSQFWIRGISSFAGHTTPLVLVDGIERNLNDLDPAEIESFSLLKDASATAMYGVRGANGIIIINTKRGTVAAPSITFRLEQSIQTPTKLPKFMNAAEQMTLLNRLAVEEGRQPLYSEDAVNKTATGYDPDLYPDVNWLDAITEDFAYSTRANLSVSGGSPIVRYSMVASYFNEHGIMATDKKLSYDTGTQLDRYNLRANVDLDVTKTTLFRFNIGGYLQHFHKQTASTDEVFNSAFETTPFVHPAVYSDGTIPRAPLRQNPWAETTQTGYARSTSSKLESLFSVEQNLSMLLPGLKARATFSFDTWTSGTLERRKIPTYCAPSTGRDMEGNLIHGQPLNDDGTEFLGHSNSSVYGNNSIYFEAALSYGQTFAERHTVDALFLYNQRSYDDGGIQPYRNQGIAGRLSYTYNRRYIGEFNFGYNGSENFAKGQRFGFFPSVALGWYLSEEPFMEPVRSLFNKIKFRGSIGKVGNDKIGEDNRRFAYLTTINSGTDGYNWGYTGNFWRQGIKEGEVGVSNLTWETVTKMNIGFELGLWNAIDLQVDVFKEYRSNIFMQRETIPAQAGFISLPWANYGKVENQGIDVSLFANKQFGKDFFVSVRGTFTYAKNEITECDEPETVIGTYRSRTGTSVNTLQGLVAERLYTAGDFDASGNLISGIPIPEIAAKVRPGDIKYIDRNDDGFINALDGGYIDGTEIPRMVLGFGANMNWKNIDFGFFFQGVGDAWRIIGGNSYFIPGGGQGALGNAYDTYTDAWTEENPSQDVFWPRLSYSESINNTVASTWWKKDMSFLRLKTVELGYSLPEKISRKIHLQTIRFYISGNNLCYFSKFKLWDPELNTNTGLKYPGMKSIMLGINLHF
ncbi:MAG: TonB-dependent receptor [Prevotellaceae bacterium]|jgi:TonB-linked SusC/RagA family outer membrane protein|nr:TonB-dependent receptor [Prevotellaceae bacterium]